METSCSGVTIKQRISDELAERRTELFNRYIQPYLNMVYKLCIRYTFNAEDVQDNYVEVLANMYKYIETYDANHDIKTWIHIVTKRCVFNVDKRRHKHQNMLADGDRIKELYHLDFLAYDDDHVSSNAMDVNNFQELYNDDILEALDQLKPPYRRALLYQQAGYKLKEIAELEYRNGALDSKNIETVKSRLFLARQQLQTLLTRDGNKRTYSEENQDGIY